MSISNQQSGTEAPSVRRMHAEQTKQAILKAAQQVFAERGYAEAGVRHIAACAEVNPALIARYYGSKLKLLEAALEASLDATVFTRVDKTEFGEAIADEFCAPRNHEAANALPMIIFAAGDTDARAAVLALLEKHIIAPLEDWFGHDDAQERVAQFLAIATGFFAYRLMLPLPPMEDDVSPSMRAWLARSLQEIVDR